MARLDKVGYPVDSCGERAAFLDALTYSYSTSKVIIDQLIDAIVTRSGLFRYVGKPNRYYQKLRII